MSDHCPQCGHSGVETNIVVMETAKVPGTPVTSQSVRSSRTACE